MSCVYVSTNTELKWKLNRVSIQQPKWETDSCGKLDTHSTIEQENIQHLINSQTCLNKHLYIRKTGI